MHNRFFLAIFLVAGFLWSYWSTLAELVDHWQRDSQYSHGFLVPVYSLFLWWLRWQPVDPGRLGTRWCGIPILLAGTGLRLTGAYYNIDWFDALSILPCLAGLCVLVGGLPLLRQAWQPIGFLVFMIPLPYQLETALASPLQSLATQASTFTMQTCGLPAIAQGNRIQLDDKTIEVAKACSGLSMLLTALTLTTAVALLGRRPLWERCFIALSAVPLALIANIVRITITGILYDRMGAESALLFFHHLAGWLMMPLVLVLLWVELRLLGWLLVIPQESPEVQATLPVT